MGFNSEKVEWRSHWSQWPCSQLLQLRTAGFLRSMELHLRQCFGLDTGVAFTLFRLPMVGGRDLQQRPYGSHAYLPPATKLGQGYVFTGVCDSVQSGGSASVHAGIPPWEQAPPGSRNPPWEQTPLETCCKACWDSTPPAQCMLGETVNKRAVCIPLECNSCNGRRVKVTPRQI